MPSRSPGPRWALTPPFHPYPASLCELRRASPSKSVGRSRAVCFLWRYPWGRPRRALPAAFSPWSPDFPPPRREARGRPPGHLIRRQGWARRGRASRRGLGRRCSTPRNKAQVISPNFLGPGLSRRRGGPVGVHGAWRRSAAVLGTVATVVSQSLSTDARPEAESWIFRAVSGGSGRFWARRGRVEGTFSPARGASANPESGFRWSESSILRARAHRRRPREGYFTIDDEKERTYVHILQFHKSMKNARVLRTRRQFVAHCGRWESPFAGRMQREGSTPERELHKPL